MIIDQLAHLHQCSLKINSFHTTHDLFGLAAIILTQNIMRENIPSAKIDEKLRMFSIFNKILCLLTFCYEMRFFSHYQANFNEILNRKMS